MTLIKWGIYSAVMIVAGYKIFKMTVNKVKGIKGTGSGKPDFEEELKVLEAKDGKVF